MQPVLTADEYRRIDKAYEGDLDTAMDMAGMAVALAAVRSGARYGKKVVVLAGTGNNGGDGYVAARYLAQRGCYVEVQSLGPPKTPEASRAAAFALAAGVRKSPLQKPHDEDVVIDAVFGGGARDGLPAGVLAWMDTPAPVVAIDYPTGLDGNTGEVSERAFRAVETVTFGALKTGHLRGVGPDHCGRVTLADIGINGGNPSMYIAEESDTVRPQRDRNTHKWSAGSVLVAGGSTGLVGAAILAARGALNFGAGAVVIATNNREAVIANSADFPTFSFEEASSRVDRFDVVLLGPGLSDSDIAPTLSLASKARKLVVDAGGLVSEVLQAATDGSAEIVITPHAGEFERLIGVGGGAYSARAVARKLDAVVLLKGNPTLITDGGLPVLVTRGGPELATIGTGDVLAGMIAALWSRGSLQLDAVITGAYFHGEAGVALRTRSIVTAGGLADEVGRFAF